MDSEQRHELKENDLQQFFENFGEFWSKHGNTLLITVTLILLVVFGIRMYRSTVSSAHDAAWFDLANANSPASLKQVALDHSDPTVQAIAYLHAGDMLLDEALRDSATTPVPEESAIDNGTDDGSTEGESATDELPDLGIDEADTPDAEQALAEAEALYGVVLNESEHALFRINALLGLGAVAEARRDWAEAAKWYEAVAPISDAYPALALKAKTRLSLLPELEQPVTFAPDPVFTPTIPITGEDGMTGFEIPDFSLPEVDLGDPGIMIPADPAPAPEGDAPASGDTP